MKKFIIAVAVALVLLFGAHYAYYNLGWHFSRAQGDPQTFVKTADKQILLDRGAGYEPFEIRGVNMGSGIPGEWATDYAIDYDTYLRWFGMIRDMGANTLRVYTIQDDEFYNAFYDFNTTSPEPLYLLHGVWVNDYVQNSHLDAYSDEFLGKFLTDSRALVDILHGKRTIYAGTMASAGSGSYRKDVSPWVIGYILGVEWEGQTVTYTDGRYYDDPEKNSYTGQYLYTSAEATPFEAMLARVGDTLLSYETDRYGTQRLLAFANWPTTDPFDYPERIESFFVKSAKVDVEHILCTDAVISGQFASYHVYPYYPDYFYFMDDYTPYGITELPPELYAQNGSLNTYRTYLTALIGHHTMPVVISEFGVSAARGMAQVDVNTGRNQGRMTETEQGQAVADCYEDIMYAGAAGSCVFSWQDEWFKRTWNTMHAIDMSRNPYWSDWQTNEQYFGLLAFDPGETECVCYVDGDAAEWTQEDVVAREPGMTLSLKYDERYVYLLVQKDGYHFAGDTLYIPMDITSRSGSTQCSEPGLRFDRAADFLLVLSGPEDSRLLVQERYEALRSTYAQEVYHFNTYTKEHIPAADSPLFVPINMILKTSNELVTGEEHMEATVFETGLLRYGCANPTAADYDSLADFCAGADFVEIKLPWQLLNFADPSRMEIHDDYYAGNYGIETYGIRGIYLGIMDGSAQGRLQYVRLKGWGNAVTSHERLKPSYYVLQELWGGGTLG